MATAVVVNGVGTWIAKGQHQTVWSNMTISTTGDVGTPQQHYAGMSFMSLYVTGTLASDTVFQFQQSPAASLTFAVGQTVCGTNLEFTSATGSGLQVNTTYLVQAGAKHFRPKITAGASGSEDVTVYFLQSTGAVP